MNRNAYLLRLPWKCDNEAYERIEDYINYIMIFRLNYILIFRSVAVRVRVSTTFVTWTNSAFSLHLTIVCQATSGTKRSARCRKKYRQPSKLNKLFTPVNVTYMKVTLFKWVNRTTMPSWRWVITMLYRGPLFRNRSAPKTSRSGSGCSNSKAPLYSRIVSESSQVHLLLSDRHRLFKPIAACL